MKAQTRQLCLTVSAAGQLQMRDRRNRKEWDHAGAPLVLHVWSLIEDRRLALPADAAGGCQCRVASRGETVELRLTWATVGVSVRVVLGLTDDQLRVRIPVSGIREANHGQYRFLGLDLLPELGAARRGQAGYFLLPHASGVLCGFDTTATVENRSFIYLHQREWEAWCNLPLFGVTQGETAGFLALIEHGEWDTEIVTRLNHAGTDRHTVHAYLQFRESKADPIDPVDRVVRYFFLQGADAGYPGMARRYRQYLLEEQHVRPLSARVRRSPHLAYEVGALSCKVFHAMKSRHPEGKGRYALFTTFNQAKRVMAEFRKAGLAHVSYELVGWNPDGHDGQYPRRLPVDARLGGEKGFRSLVAYARRLGQRVGVHDNYVDMYACSPDWNEKLLMKDRDGELVRGGVWGGGQMYYICGSQMCVFGKRDLPRMRALDFNGICYLDAMPRAGRACFDPKHGHAPGRRADGEGIVDLLRLARRIMRPRPIGTENVFGYTIKHQDFAGHIPPAPHPRSLYPVMRERPVPFLDMVVHGIIKYHLGDPRHVGSPEKAPAWILREIEYGAMPRFEFSYRDKHRNDPGYLHFGDYRPWLPVMREQYRILCAELAPLQYQFMVNHEVLSGDRRRTTYADGTAVTVDYKREAYRVNDGPWRKVTVKV
jgi:hypothetical protein